MHKWRHTVSEQITPRWPCTVAARLETGSVWSQMINGWLLKVFKVQFRYGANICWYADVCFVLVNWFLAELRSFNTGMKSSEYVFRSLSLELLTFNNVSLYNAPKSECEVMTWKNQNCISLTWIILFHYQNQEKGNKKDFQQMNEFFIKKSWGDDMFLTSQTFILVFDFFLSISFRG